jgi:hypothetical protein
MPKLTELQKAERELLKAERDSKKACMARGALVPGSSRARLTTANARWMILAEHRDRMIQRVDSLGGDSAAIIAGAENG